MMIMELTELKYLNNIDMLKYLVYFQVCQDNSLHLYTYQIYKVWVLNENKNQTSANKYTNLQCII